MDEIKSVNNTFLVIDEIRTPIGARTAEIAAEAVLLEKCLWLPTHSSTEQAAFHFHCAVTLPFWSGYLNSIQ